MPRWAARRTGLVGQRPVKAPFLWPKKRRGQLVLISAQLTATKGRSPPGAVGVDVARTTSLPVPFSPRMRSAPGRGLRRRDVGLVEHAAQGLGVLRVADQLRGVFGQLAALQQLLQLAVRACSCR